MRLTNFVSPISLSDGDEILLSNFESFLDGSLDFFGNLDSDSNVASLVSDCNNSLHSGSLSSLGLLLD